MSEWPTEPIIRINRGTLNGKSIKDVIAGIGPCNSYTILSGKSQGSALVPAYGGDSIREWTPLTAVPTASIEALRQVFQGVILSPAQQGALYGVTSYVPPSLVALVDQALTVAKRLRGEGEGLSGNALAQALLQRAALLTPEPSSGACAGVAACAAHAIEGLGHSEPWDAIAEAANESLEDNDSAREYAELASAVGKALSRSSLSSFVDLGGKAIASAARAARREAV